MNMYHRYDRNSSIYDIVQFIRILLGLIAMNKKMMPTNIKEM